MDQIATKPPATVSRLGREADRETREFVVDVLVTELPANWAVGQRADVYIEVDRRAEVPVIPAEFVVWHEKTPGVCWVTNRLLLSTVSEPSR